MRDDHRAYRHWDAVYRTAVRLSATDDPLAMFRWIATHPDLSMEDDHS
jgi:hypothetical protein